MSAAEVVEGYTVVGDLSSMQQPHLLTPAGGDANVILHVTHTLPDCPVPPLLLAADLAEHGGPRELSRARELIREALT